MRYLTADLAILIIDLYEDLVNYVDDKGLTPLHVLASKPTAFRSGTHLHFIERLIYECKSPSITQTTQLNDSEKIANTYYLVAPRTLSVQACIAWPEKQKLE